MARCLPGVTVTLTGVGAPQTFITAADGNFRFINLSPGSYALKAELSGMGTAVRNNIRVSVGQNSDVTLTVAPSVAESITVTADAPLIDTRKTGTGAVITRAELEQLPTGRDPFVIIGLAPGVLLDRVNVGGSESGQQDIVVARGASDTQKTFNVDGVNITDVGSVGSTPTYYDFDSFEEIQVTTGGSDPRIQTPGAQLNMVTKRGTNDFKGIARYLVADKAWEATPKPSGEAARISRTATPSIETATRPVELGGPILRDKLWFWGAYAKQDIKLFVGQPIGTPVNPDNTILKDWNAKINLQIDPDQQRHVLLHVRRQAEVRPLRGCAAPARRDGQSERTDAHVQARRHADLQPELLPDGSLLARPQPVRVRAVERAAGGANQPYIDADGVWHRGYFLYEHEPAAGFVPRRQLVLLQDRHHSTTS